MRDNCWKRKLELGYWAGEYRAWSCSIVDKGDPYERKNYNIVFTEVLKVGNETNLFNYISQNYYAETNDTFVTLIKLADN